MLVLVAAAALLPIRASSAESPASDSTAAGALVLFAADSVTGVGVRDADVSARRPGYDREWWAYTDSTGFARLTKMVPGDYRVTVCQNEYDRGAISVKVRPSATETLRVALKYHGRPKDGRPCETRYWAPETTIVRDSISSRSRRP
jgi:hypothetical protein